jgi:putative heme-binding domain-containing protein
MRLRSLLIIAILPCGQPYSQAADSVAGLKLPAGFVATEFSGPQLSNDIYTLHIDSAGRIIVCGRGYAHELIDRNSDGRADDSRDLVAGLKDGPMGALWEGDTLYLVANGGLKRYRGVDGTKPLTEPELILAVRTGGEHDAHAVKRGPDGWLYLLCGNMAGVTKKLITSKQSPVQDPVAGVLLRVNPHGKQVEFVADGFRNPYDFDFNIYGEPFTFDSDNERCVGLPWYEPTRFYHIAQGGNHGWMSPQVSQTWRRPPYFLDVTPPVCTLGRGSPTGVVCYRHTHFPKKFHGGFFLADWTFGKVWYVPLTRAGTSYTGKPEVFLEATTENGFAPTGMAVHPESGELFIATGGRGTRGAVYRISHQARRGQGVPIPFVSQTKSIAIRPKLNTTLESALSVLSSDAAAHLKLNAVRSIQVSLGDLTAPESIGGVFEGYTLRKPPTKDTAAHVAKFMRNIFPSGSHELDRELSRTLAAVGDTNPTTARQIAKCLTSNSDPLDDIHYLIVLATLPTPLTKSEQVQVATSLLNLDQKLAKSGHTRDRHWPLRIAEATSALIRTTPELATALIESASFGRPEHTLYAKLNGIDRADAARRFLKTSKEIPFEWTPAVVEVIGSLPHNEVRPLLLKLWERGDLTDVIVPLLAHHPVNEDRQKYIAGLRSLNSITVTAAAKSLVQLRPGNGEELIAALSAYRRVGDGKPEMATRKALVALLQNRTGQQYIELKDWEDWFVRERPDLAKQLVTKGYDSSAWRNRLNEIDWGAGNPKSGRQVFLKARCEACHNGTQAVGPSLQGVTKRFSRDDLMTAILDPNRDVPPRYRSSRFTTSDGKFFEGVIIYEAVDGVILQTGPDTTVRISGDRIESRQPLTTSLMPTGLLESLSNREVADLIAYLKFIDVRPPPR